MKKLTTSEDRFNKEMRVLKKLTTEKYNGFPKLIDYGSDKTNYYIVMSMLG